MIGCPIQPPSNRSALRRSPGRRRVVVFDVASQFYVAALLDILDVEGFFARSADDFIALVHAQRPHIAFVHIFNVKAILRLKADPAIRGTPVVILSTTIAVNDIMSEAGLIGPIIDVPYMEREFLGAINHFGRGPDQPFPEALPYLMSDVARTEASRQPSEHQFGERKILLWCRDAFVRHFLTRTVKGLRSITPALPLFVPEVREKFFAEMNAGPPALVILFTDSGTWLKTVGARLLSSGIQVLVLSPTNNEVYPSDLVEGEWTMPHHLLPMPKGRLTKVIEDILERR